MRAAWLTLLLSASCAGAAAPPADPVEDARLAIRTKEFAHAIELLRRLARDGSAEADYLLGLAAWNGIGLNPDLAAARASLERAASRDHARAQFALAALLAQGSPAERAAASKWLERSAATGYSPAVTARDAGKLPLADPRESSALDIDLRFEIARCAVRSDDLELLHAVGAQQLIRRTDDFGRTLLAIAADTGSSNTARDLITTGASAEVTDQFGVTPLMLAARHPDEQVTAALLGAGARVATRDRAGRDALNFAASANQPGQVRRLLAAGAQLEGADLLGGTATDAAQRANADAALAALRDAGGHVSVAAAARHEESIDTTRPGALYVGWPPLLIAAAHDDAAEIRRQIAAGTSADIATARGETALLVAVDSRAVNAARALLELGANPRHHDAAGSGALERAVRSGNSALLSALIERAAPASNEASALLAIAVQRSDAAAAQLLLAHGAKVAEPDADGMRPLARAARLGDVDMIKLLIDRGAPAAATDALGRSALWYAAGSRVLPAVEVLLALKVPVADADREGETVLLAAIRSGDEAIVRRLIQAGAKVDENRGRGAPLRVAAELGNVAIVDALLARKPDVNAVDAFGETALMAAARSGSEAMCATLLSAGANPSLRSRDRATAGDIADARGFAALAKRLRG